MKPEVKKLAEQLQKEWMELHNDWRTPVWGVFRDRAERIIDGREESTTPLSDNHSTEE